MLKDFRQNFKDNSIKAIKMPQFNEAELTGPTKPSSEVLVKGLSLMGTPDGFTGTVCKKRQQC